MVDLVPSFQNVGLYDFMANMCDYNEMIVRQFLTLLKLTILRIRLSV